MQSGTGKIIASLPTYSWGWLGHAAVFATAFLFLTPASTLACPVCGSETGRRVREGIFNEQFAANLLAIGLPFVIVAAGITLFQLGIPFRRKTDRLKVRQLPE